MIGEDIFGWVKALYGAQFYEMFMFVHKKMPNQFWAALNLDCTHCAGQQRQLTQQCEYDGALWHHSIVWDLFWGIETSKSCES